MRQISLWAGIGCILQKWDGATLHCALKYVRSTIIIEKMGFF